MTLPEALEIFLTLWLVLPGAGGITISDFKPETNPKPGSRTIASWSRDPSKDPRTFEFGWIEIGSNATHIHITGSTINITDTTTAGSMEVTYPFESGQYNLAIFAVGPTNGPLFINDQEIDVKSPTDGTVTSSEPSTFATTASTSERLQTTSEASFLGNDDPGPTNGLFRPSVLTSSGSSVTNTSVSDASLPPETHTITSERRGGSISCSELILMNSQVGFSSYFRQCYKQGILIYRASVDRYTCHKVRGPLYHLEKLPKNLTGVCFFLRSQPSDVSQTHRSTPMAVAPIVAGTIGGLLMLGVIALAVRCHLRKRRSGTQTSVIISPFLTHESGNRAVPTVTDGTGIRQGSERPGINQGTISRNFPDTEFEPPPPVNLEYAEDASSTAITPVAQSSLEGASLTRAVPYRPDMRVFTTDELVMELKQRLWEEGRWELDESLPGYPESD
ncbi:hypothetical protein PQX77_014103 [Marasmius sp. AFHP31]|nr:hypothetical protein PQX77_014103 [Marasmius sp. AFHP31]